MRGNRLRLASLLIALGALLGSCSTTDTLLERPSVEHPPLRHDHLTQSFADWRSLKAANGSDYQYEVHFSTMLGEYGKTTLEVRDDRVVRRTYEGRDAQDGGWVVESWTERGDKLGFHTAGAPVRVVEDLYAICKDDVLTQDRFQNSFDLAFYDDGLLKRCLVLPKDVADASGTGVRIDLIRFL